MTNEEGPALPECGDSIDPAAFEQILEMDDDDDDREFSKSIVFGFFEQAENTFITMDEKLEERDLKELSSLGHFLKGSSATLGLTHIKDGCEKIQHLGLREDDTGAHRIEESDEEILSRIRRELARLRDEYDKVKRCLKRYYGEN